MRSGMTVRLYITPAINLQPILPPVFGRRIKYGDLLWIAPCRPGTYKLTACNKLPPHGPGCGEGVYYINERKTEMELEWQ